MSVIRSLSVGKGDMFYIKHNSMNFSIVDCCLVGDKKDAIIKEIKAECDGERMRRFISTHPDEDHIRGIEDLCQKFAIWNFYCVKNEATKKNPSQDFKYYVKLRDSETNVIVHHLTKGCRWRWMNDEGEGDDGCDYGSAGIHVLWPDKDDDEVKKWLKSAADGKTYNNISPIIIYRCHNSAVAMWMGDVETDYVEKIKDKVNWPKVDILFAPHHGRDTAKLPESVLKDLSPKVVVIGEGQSNELNYYSEYDTLTQNRAKNITFVCRAGKVDVFSSSESYKPGTDFLKEDTGISYKEEHYLGSFDTHHTA